MLHTAILAASSKEDNLGPRDLIYGSNETTPPSIYTISILLAIECMTFPPESEPKPEPKSFIHSYDDKDFEHKKKKYLCSLLKIRYLMRSFQCKT
uniref:Uncharacterized protein n=1 Tax=Wuchereria bancrofti TaxID=6293 RepID=A0AAF5RUD8_WUCBA